MILIVPIKCNIRHKMFFLSIILVTILNSASSFEINLQVPKVFKSHSPVWINCSTEYVKDGEIVSEIKWYKNDQLFYTWDAEKKEGEQIDIPGYGIDKFDLIKSTGNAIYLQSTDLNTTGCYECEVILSNGDAKKKSAKTSAFYVPLYRPQPMIYVKQYEGLYVAMFINDMYDMFHVKCTSKPSFPDAEISLLINGKERDILYDVEHVLKKPYRVYSEDYKRYNLVNHFVANYKFVITPELVERGFMRVSCLSTIRVPHGMVERLESDEVRIRVLDTYRKIYSLAHIDNKKYWLYGFLGIVVSLLGIWYIIDGSYDPEKVVIEKKKKRQKSFSGIPNADGDTDDDVDDDDNVSNKSSYDYAITIRRKSVAAGTIETLAADALSMKNGGPIPENMRKNMMSNKQRPCPGNGVDIPEVATINVPLNGNDRIV